MTNTQDARANLATTAFACTHSDDFTDILMALGCSLVVSTYQSNKLILLSPRPGGLTQLLRSFKKPMGIALDGDRMAIATRDEVVVLKNTPGLATSYPSKQRVYDALYMPRAVYFTSELDLHDMAWGRQGRLWAVNTRFSCLGQIDAAYSFTPVWHPPFIRQLAPHDHCHLNGMAMVAGEPAYATALGETDMPSGWRTDKANGGVLIDIASEEVVVRDLAMPHSPRVYDGQVYLLNSARGELLRIDPQTGHAECICLLPGFARGLARHGDYFFIGLSKLRSDTLGGLPISAHKALFCGVVIVHLPSGRLQANIRYLNTCEEIYDVQVLPGQLRPGILGIGDDRHRQAIALPQGGYWARGIHA